VSNESLFFLITLPFCATLEGFLVLNCRFVSAFSSIGLYWTIIQNFE